MGRGNYRQKTDEDYIFFSINHCMGVSFCPVSTPQTLGAGEGGLGSFQVVYLSITELFERELRRCSDLPWPAPPRYLFWCRIMSLPPTRAPVDSLPDPPSTEGSSAVSKVPEEAHLINAGLLSPPPHGQAS